MKKVLELIESGFETTQTESGIDKMKLQRVARLLNNMLRKKGATSSKLKVNHVDISGFVQFGDKFIYVSLSNIGWSLCHTVLVRTAKDNKDYSGGANNWIRLDDNLIDSIVEFAN